MRLLPGFEFLQVAPNGSRISTQLLRSFSYIDISMLQQLPTYMFPAFAARLSFARHVSST